MGPLRFRERLEPVRDFTETLVPGDFGHAWIHVGIFVRFTGDRGLQVLTRAPEREIRRRVAAGFEVFEMAVSVASFALGRRTKNRGDVVLAFYVGLGCEIEIAPVGLRFACECTFWIAVRVRALELHDFSSFTSERPVSRPDC